MRAWRAVWLAILAVLLTDCASDIRLRHPGTGQVAVCKGGYRTQGLGGLVDQSAKDLQMRCLDDFQRQGYERVPQ